MRGRETLERLNRVIDEFNKALNAKYSLLKKKSKTSMSDAAIRAYHDQELPETKGKWTLLN